MKKYKKTIFLIMLFSTLSASAFDVFDYGMTQQEATGKAMKRCMDTSSHPERCHVIQVNQGDFGAYAKWQVQVADWTR